MAKIDLKFLCKIDEYCYIKCERKDNIIEILLEQHGIINCIHLDKSTAIKFAKTLRTEINKIQE